MSVENSYLFFPESRGGCGCGGSDDSLALPLLLGALFLATAYLNNQIIMAAERKRKKRYAIIESKLKFAKCFKFWTLQIKFARSSGIIEIV